jgi:hypothetical protein
MTTQYKPFIDHGQPMQRKRAFPAWAIAVLSVVGAFALLCFVGGVLAVLSAPEPHAETRPVEHQEPVGEVTSVLNIEVLDVRTEKNTLGDAYTAIEVSAVNASDARVYVGPLDWYAIDVDGYKHDAVYGPFGSRSDRLPGTYLNNGHATTGVFHLEGEVDVATVVYQRWPTDDPIEVNVE